MVRLFVRFVVWAVARYLRAARRLDPWAGKEGFDAYLDGGGSEAYACKPVDGFLFDSLPKVTDTPAGTVIQFAGKPGLVLWDKDVQPPAGYVPPKLMPLQPLTLQASYDPTPEDEAAMFAQAALHAQLTMDAALTPFSRN